MKLKLLKRANRKAWEARKKTAFNRRLQRDQSRLMDLCQREAGPDWTQVSMTSHDFPGGTMFLVCHAKRPGQTRPVPSGEPIYIQGIYAEQ